MKKLVIELANKEIVFPQTFQPYLLKKPRKQCEQSTRKREQHKKLETVDDVVYFQSSMLT